MIYMNKKIIAVAVVLILVIAAGLVYFVAQGNEDKNTIKIAIVQHNFEPIYIADELGFFDEEGVNVELVIVPSGSLSATALTTGMVDLAGFGPDPLLGILNNYGYDDYKWIGTYMLDDGVQGAASIASGIDLNHPETLLGINPTTNVCKVIGINTTVSYFSLFLEYLNAANAHGYNLQYQILGEKDTPDPNMVNIRNYDNNALASSLGRYVDKDDENKGHVDMIIGGAANAKVVEKNPDKFKYVEIDDDHPEYKSYMPVGLMSSVNTINEKSEAIEKVMRAIQKGCEYIYNEDGTVNEDACKIAIDSLGNQWDINVQTKYFTSADWGFEFSQIDVDSMNAALKNLGDRFDKLGDTVDPNQYFEPRFLKAIFGDQFIWPL